MRPILLLCSIVCVALFGLRDSRADDRAPPFTPSWAPPILSMVPDTGPPGTRVVLTGAQFDEDAAVRFGGEPMQIVHATRQVIVAIIPDGVRGANYVYVVDHHARARTVLPFRIDRQWQPPDRRADWRHQRLVIEPDRGWPGMQVHLYGHFSSAARPFYGRREMFVHYRARNYLVVDIPAFAMRDQYITVLDGRRKLTSRIPFVLLRHGPPVHPADR